MTTAAEIITGGLRAFGIIDITEDASGSDLSNGVTVLNEMLRSEQADGACQYLMKTEQFTVPAGVNGQIYTFSIGVADPAYAVQRDAVAVKAIWLNDINLTVNRETRAGPKADVVRTTYPGIITKWHQERQVDGSILVYAWQPPNRAVPMLIEYGARVPALTNPDGSDVVALPPEGIQDAKLLFGRKVANAYGRTLDATSIVYQESQRVNDSWRQWARGQQWLRFVRA